MHQSIKGPAGALWICDGGSGEAMPVICAHAMGCVHDHWAAALQRLRPERRALAFDLRGHGRSEAPRDGDWGIEGFGDDLLAVLDARNIERAVFVGNSLGAFTAIAAAVRAPDRCAGLFLVDPGADPASYPREEIAQMLERFEDFAPDRREKLLEGARAETRQLVLPTLEANQSSTIVSALRRLFEFHAVDALRTWSGPTFVLAGPMGSGPDALQHVLDLPHRELHDVSHFVHLDAPDVFHEELDRFLSKVE